MINAAFTPSTHDVDAARRTIDQYHRATDADVGAVVDLDGVMLDEAVVRRARRVLARADTIVSRAPKNQESAPMMNVLDGLRVVEGSAFVAAPLGGLTLAQLGADVIRFDAIGGGIDYQRWPVTDDGVSLYWAGLNKGKRSIADRPVRSPRDASSRDRADHRAGRRRRHVPVELPGSRLARPTNGCGRAARPRLREHHRQPRRVDRGRLHRQRVVGRSRSQRARSGRCCPSTTRCPRGTSPPASTQRSASSPPSGTARATGVGQFIYALARRRRVHDGRQPRVPRSGPGAPRETDRRSATTCTARSAPTSRRRTAGG